MGKDLVLDVEESPKKKSQWLLFAIQHILAMLVACITVPLITGLPIGPTLIAAGVGTLIYILTTKKKSPVFLSSSFAYLAPMSTALTLGVIDDGTMNYAAVMLGMTMVGIIYVIIALVIKKVGTKWLNQILPPVVIGPIIMVIGLGLAGSAIGNITTGTAGIQMYMGENMPWQFSFMSILVALFACFLTAFCATSKRKNLTLIPFVIGMVGAYLLACVSTGIGFLSDINWMKIIDYSVFEKDWATVEAWITTDFLFVKSFSQNALFTFKTVGQVALLFIPVALVTICEHIGDHKNLGNIINRDLLNENPGLTRTLIGDGVATAVSGVLCGAANTTYGENVAVIGVSKIASVSVIIFASFLSILLGFFAPLTTLLQTIPACITGGVSLILYGFIASSGVKLLIKEKVDFSKTRNIVIASVILVSGIGGLALGFGGVAGANIITISATAVAMLLGIILNLILPKIKCESIEILSFETFKEQWLNEFAEGVSKEDLRKRVMDSGNFIWHIFSWQLMSSNLYLENDEALNAYNKISKEKVYFYCGISPEEVQLIEFKDLPMEDFLMNTEIYITASDFSWTFIKTHESDYGPYFMKKKEE